MSIPQTRAEALARGFTEISTAVARERRAKRAARDKEFSAHLAGAADQVDCNLCADGTKCDTVVEHGKVTVYFCKGGVCSNEDALEGDVGAD